MVQNVPIFIWFYNKIVHKYINGLWNLIAFCSVNLVVSFDTSCWSPLQEEDSLWCHRWQPIVNDFLYDNISNDSHIFKRTVVPLIINVPIEMPKCSNAAIRTRFYLASHLTTHLSVLFALVDEGKPTHHCAIFNLHSSYNIWERIDRNLLNSFYSLCKIRHCVHRGFSLIKDIIYLRDS